MNSVIRVFLIGIVACSCSATSAQDADPHSFLKKFAGEWESQSEGTAGPGQPKFVAEGVMKSRMLGDLWLVSDITVGGAGFQVGAVQTIGYDPEKKKYIGTWVDSMFNHMWRYEGSVDESGRKLILEAEGPNPSAAGKMSNFRDTYEFKSDDHIVSTSLMQNEDGEWVVLMTGEMKRKQ